jgi:hypothetical protein
VRAKIGELVPAPGRARAPRPDNGGGGHYSPRCRRGGSGPPAGAYPPGLMPLFAGRRRSVGVGLEHTPWYACGEVGC